MVIVMKDHCLKKEVGEVMSVIRNMGLDPRMMAPEPKIVLGVVEDLDKVKVDELQETLSSMSGVEGVEAFGTSWKLVSRDFMKQGTTIKVGPYTIGEGKPVVMAGPCAVESRESIIEIANAVKESGAAFLRGGAFKPRSSPYSFRGLKEDGLKYMKEASELTGLPIITEVLTPEEVPLVAQYSDILQIGARNMQNFALLEAVGDHDRPVFLKRGLMATIKELLLSAEYILARGNSQVMLCERGIRTFETATRNTLDISAVPVLKQSSHLPVIVDPSHAVGKRELVAPVALAAVAAGADGLMVEVHPEPDKALSDGRQSLDFKAFQGMMSQIDRLTSAIRQ